MCKPARRHDPGKVQRRVAGAGALGPRPPCLDSRHLALRASSPKAEPKGPLFMLLYMAGRLVRRGTGHRPTAPRLGSSRQSCLGDKREVARGGGRRRQVSGYPPIGAEGCPTFLEHALPLAECCHILSGVMTLNSLHRVSGWVFAFLFRLALAIAIVAFLSPGIQGRFINTVPTPAPPTNQRLLP